MGEAVGIVDSALGRTCGLSATGGKREFYGEELREFYCTRNIVRVIK
jgi:hypothetical protein